MPTTISAKALRDARIASGKTQSEVADALGVAQPVVSRYETGGIMPTAATIAKLADLYGTHPGKFFVEVPAESAA